MQRDAEVVVVGAGVVGLAAAAALARAGHAPLILERREAIARETSARNSEVIHAGLYYPADSLKAKLCVEGRHLLYERCERFRIPHRRCGKWVVATREEELAELDALEVRGRENGVEGLTQIGVDEITRREPQVRALAALESPESGIVDAHALCDSYLAEAEAHGAVLLTRIEVQEAGRTSSGYRLEVLDADGRRTALRCEALVNAGGLRAESLARALGMDVGAAGYRLHPCKGDYFSLVPGAGLRVGRLVYPVARGAGLGVHATIDLAGRIRFGPDAEYVQTPEYQVDPGKAAGFATLLRRFLPELREEWLQPEFAGVRPKLSGPGEPFRDFVVAEESAAGFPALVNCIGIESPGLTAAGAIARRVTDLLAGL